MTKKKSNNNRNVGLILLLLLIVFLIYWLATGETKPVDKLKTNNGFNTEGKKAAENTDEIVGLQTMDDYETGKGFFEQGNYEQAERSLRQAILKVTDIKTASEIYYLLGQAQFKQRKFGPARMSFTLSKHENSDNMLEEIRAALNNPDPDN